MPHPSESKAREAFRITNDLLMDLMGGMQLHRGLHLMLARTPAPQPIPTQVDRLCLFYVILSLAKWYEFCKRYRDVIPGSVETEAHQLSALIQQKGILEFRNKVVGHIWDDRAQRALTNKEIEARLASILGGGSIAVFMMWANETTVPPDPSSVTSIIEHVRDALGAKYGFTEADLFK